MPFEDKTDAELLYLAQHGARYSPAVANAAVQELQRRGLIPTELPTPAPTPVLPPEPVESWPRQLRRLVKSIAWPRQGYYITPLLILSNLLVFLLMGLSGVSLLNPTGPDLVAWGSNFSPLTPMQPWRLLTSVFLHGGPAHLFLNMSALLLLGLLAEAKVGRGPWLLTYLLSGIGGSLTSWWWHTQGINSVGASGAIFGLYGLLLALLLTRTHFRTRQDRAGIIGLLLYFALGSLVGGLEGPTTDNAAHVGGLLTGFATGLVLGLVGSRKV
ncbi:rhomboid family intramembrane serine protease [Hymenobacter volaticus]|uniref:Rhomboid family intramembrane serine protease n=1 Tax=Hymenobacter volaticus TaxID=2932254 RepID=A0ABY4G2Q2_9BACT|nr:rhomboid family intramembrane serine protease [Hymenobacter volaticus]UOQ65145.1 rhomboid family intramembrane serine protease [Hymenobacter volaticus]